MNALPKSSWLLTVDEYLAFEENSECRHEYVGGEVHAMVGASERHQLIVFNIASAMRAAARSRGCRILLNDVKLQVSSNAIYYPDIMVLCDAGDSDPYIKRNPMMITEVLSPSTAATDRREKMLAYRQLPDLLCYLIVHQDQRRIENHWRENPDSQWEMEMIVDHTVKVSGLDVTISLDDLYEGIDFDAPA